MWGGSSSFKSTSLAVSGRFTHRGRSSARLPKTPHQGFLVGSCCSPLETRTLPSSTPCSMARKRSLIQFTVVMGVDMTAVSWTSRDLPAMPSSAVSRSSNSHRAQQQKPHVPSLTFDVPVMDGTRHESSWPSRCYSVSELIQRNSGFSCIISVPPKSCSGEASWHHIWPLTQTTYTWKLPGQRTSTSLHFLGACIVH